MGFVDDQNRAESFGSARNQKLPQIEQKLALVLTGGGQSEVGEDVLQELGRRQAAIEYIGIRNVPTILEQAEQAAQEKSFTGAHFAGDYNEPLVPADAIVERRKGLVVPSGGHKIIG